MNEKRLKLAATFDEVLSIAVRHTPKKKRAKRAAMKKAAKKKGKK